MPGVALGQSSCGEKIPALGIFDQISQYALWLALAFMIPGIIFDHKIWKKTLLLLAILPFVAWAYVNFFIDYNSLKKEIFNHNIFSCVSFNFITSFC